MYVRANLVHASLVLRSTAKHFLNATASMENPNKEPSSISVKTWILPKGNGQLGKPCPRRLERTDQPPFENEKTKRSVRTSSKSCRRRATRWSTSDQLHRWFVVACEEAEIEFKPIREMEQFRTLVQQLENLRRYIASHYSQHSLTPPTVNYF